MDTLAITEIPIEKEFDLPADWEARVELGRCYVRRALLDFWELGEHLLETREQYGRLLCRYLDAIGRRRQQRGPVYGCGFQVPRQKTPWDSGHQTL
jgi:hypothetical protein